MTSFDTFSPGSPVSLISNPYISSSLVNCVLSYSIVNKCCPLVGVIVVPANENIRALSSPEETVKPLRTSSTAILVILNSPPSFGKVWLNNNWITLTWQDVKSIFECS